MLPSVILMCFVNLCFTLTKIDADVKGSMEISYIPNYSYQTN